MFDWLLGTIFIQSLPSNTLLYMKLDTVHRLRLYCIHVWLAIWHYFHSIIALKHTTAHVTRHCPLPQALLLAWLIGYLELFSWQHCNIPHKLLTWLQLIFTCPFIWKQHRRNSTFVLLMKALRMQRKSWKGFHNKASRNVANNLQSLSEVRNCTRGLFLRQCSLICCIVLYFSKIKWFREHFEATIHMPLSLVLYRKGILRFPLFKSDLLFSKISVLNYGILFMLCHI